MCTIYMYMNKHIYTQYTHECYMHYICTYINIDIYTHMQYKSQNKYILCMSV